MNKDHAAYRLGRSEHIVDPVIGVEPLLFPWKTADPFLVCGYNVDAYPPGTEHLGPKSMVGRALGHEVDLKHGWRMYYGETVPGFPAHPHRGFEIITMVRRGFVDHSDSMGATARYGEGDVQWLTAGSGITHAEMFPLLENERSNHLELFQVWLNLPAAQKLCAPHLSMFWKQNIPCRKYVDANGKVTVVDVIAGRLDDAIAPAPPPDSWAAKADNDVAIWMVRMEADATFTLPAAQSGSNRNVYLYEGGSLEIAGWHLPSHHRVTLRSHVPATLQASGSGVSFLLLQGRPIAEPVVQRGSFVMNTAQEIQTAFSDYQSSRFGRWPFVEQGPVHPRPEGRFARYADGRVEYPD